MLMSQAAKSFGDGLSELLPFGVLDAPVLSKSFTRFRIPWNWSGQPAILQSPTRDCIEVAGQDRGYGDESQW